jgi:Abi-like protein
MLTWIQDWLSQPRLDRYLNECGGDPDRAFQLYVWNGRVASAFLRDLADMEVLVRNAFDGAVQDNWEGSSHWLLDPESPVLVVKLKPDGTDSNHIAREMIQKATAQAGGPEIAAPGKIVAELTFGFWASLVNKVRTDDLWTPYISRCFVSPHPSRKDVDRRLASLNSFRNRVAHHEPLINTDLLKMHARILDVCGWISPDVRTHVEGETLVPGLLEDRPSRASSSSARPPALDGALDEE